jgi:hypothetical protein
MQWRWYATHHILVEVSGAIELTRNRDRGAEITEEEVEQSYKELKVLQSWFAKAVLRADERSGSTAIIVLPVGPTEPNYRDVYILPGPRLGVDALSLASFMRMPQLVVPSTSHPAPGLPTWFKLTNAPVGQVDYQSRVSGREESFPVCSSIAGAHGEFCL